LEGEEDRDPSYGKISRVSDFLKIACAQSTAAPHLLFSKLFKGALWCYTASVCVMP